MHTYARVVEGVVVEIVQPAIDEQGNEVPIEQRFTPGFVETLRDITDMSPQPGYMWRFDGTNFSDPVSWTPPA